MSSRSKTSLFPKFAIGKKDHDNFLLFNEKDYFSSPQSTANRINDSKKEHRKSKKSLALRRNLQAENKAGTTSQSPVDHQTQCLSPDLQFGESPNPPKIVTSPDNVSNDQDKENNLSRSGGQKKSKNVKKSMRQALSTWRQKLRKSTLRRSPLITNTPGCSPEKVKATPTSHVKLYSPFCIDTPSQPTIRYKIDVHYAKPRRFAFSSPGRSKKSVNDGIQCLSSLADGLDAALGCKE